MFKLYKDVAKLALHRAAKAWALAASLPLFAGVLFVGVLMAAALGRLGGFLIGILLAVCIASYLHMLGRAVDGQRLHPSDATQGVRARFWDVTSVLFALWLIGLFTTLIAKSAGPSGVAIVAMVGLAMAFFFNPVPELLYQSDRRSFDLLRASGSFVVANPVVWFLPNVLGALALMAGTGSLRAVHPGEFLLELSTMVSGAGLVDVAQRLPLWSLPLLLVAFHFVMVFRGLLFRELDKGSPRLQAWRARH